MTTNRPSCPLCGNNTKKNGTTSKSTTRWRCTHCGHSFTRNTQTHNKNTATMALFIQWATGTQSLTTFAAHHGVTRQTMHHRFRWCWWIIPTPTIDSFRIHDQIFLDATYLKSGCLLIAASKTHVINWTWARHETEVSQDLFRLSRWENLEYACRFGVVGTASLRSWYRCSAYPVLQGVFFHS